MNSWPGPAAAVLAASTKPGGAGIVPWLAWCVTQGGSCAIAEADQGDVLAVAEVKNA